MRDARLKTGMLESVDDSGDVRRGTATWLGREGQPIQVAGIYGVLSNPPAGSQVLLLPQNGQESASIGLPDHPAIRPLKNLLSGEVAVDQTYMGGTEKNRHAHKRTHGTKGTMGKVAVMGIVQKDRLLVIIHSLIINKLIVGLLYIL